jgi:hypothetical protein
MAEHAGAMCWISLKYVVQQGLTADVGLAADVSTTESLYCVLQPSS